MDAGLPAGFACVPADFAFYHPGLFLANLLWLF
jgi:hypothetical protein